MTIRTSVTRVVPVLLACALGGCTGSDRRGTGGGGGFEEHGDAGSAAPSTAALDGTFHVEAPSWEENNCGAPQEIEGSYTFEGSGDYVNVAEAPGLRLELSPSGSRWSGDLDWTENLESEGIDCSLDFNLYFSVEDLGDGTFDGEQRIQVERSALTEGSDCDWVAMERFGFSSWDQWGCRWNVRYALTR